MITIDASIWVSAFDPRDRFHKDSIAFLHDLAQQKIRLHDPMFVLIEVACAMARRSSNPATGEIAYERLRSHPALTLHPLDERCLATARKIGVSRLLRGADAIYAATAALYNAPLVTWDQELVQKAEARMPSMWNR